MHDVPAYRCGLASGLVKAGFTVAEASAASDVDQGWDACLMMFGPSDGCEALAVMRDVGVVVALLSEPTPAGFRAALRCGAAGAARQNDPVCQIIRVLRAAMSGWALLPVEVARDLTSPAAVSAPQLQLPEQAAEWLRALARGVSVHAIARDTGYSDRQMYRLMQRVYHAVGARNRDEAIVAATRLGLVP